MCFQSSLTRVDKLKIIVVRYFLNKVCIMLAVYLCRSCFRIMFFASVLGVLYEGSSGG